MPNPLTAHFKQPAGVQTVTLCGGLLVAFIALISSFSDDAPTRDVLLLFTPFVAFPCGLFFFVRWIRPFKKSEARPPQRCPLCARAVATSPVRYTQITGALIVMIPRELPAYLCRHCSVRAFTRMTLHTLAFGGWSLFSLFIAPAFIVNNLVFLARSQLTPGNAPATRVPPF